MYLLDVLRASGCHHELSSTWSASILGDAEVGHLVESHVQPVPILGPEGDSSIDQLDLGH